VMELYLIVRKSFVPLPTSFDKVPIASTVRFFPL
jgi:hypothetical protein